MKRNLSMFKMVTWIFLNFWKLILEIRIIKDEATSGLAFLVFRKIYFVGTEKVKNEKGEIEMEFYKIVSPNQVIRITGQIFEQAQYHPTSFENIWIPFKVTPQGIVLWKYVIVWTKENRKLKTQ